MRRGEMSCSEVVAEHLELLEACQPRLNAATEILRDEALAQSRTPRPGPLSGLPVSVKETFALAGRSITAGSRRMPPIQCDADANAVSLLRRAGAIVIARSNVPEFAMNPETENPVFGRTANPLNLDRTCGGSSGGEGALVAAGCTAAGLGSDILGSIRIPAAMCGIVGFKPASGAVDKSGAWPDLRGSYTDSWLAAGPLVRSVRDARLLYSVLTHHPLEQAASTNGLRLLLPGDFPLTYRDDSIKAAVEASRNLLANAGMVPQEVVLGDVRRWYRTKIRYLASELMPLIVKGLTDADGKRFTLGGEFLRRFRGRPEVYEGLVRLLVMGPALRYRSRRGTERALAILQGARKSVRSLLGRDGILLLPTLGTLALPHGQMNKIAMKPGVNGLFTATTFCNYIDLPAITVPAPGFRSPESGLIPGVMLAACPGSEGPLLDAAAALEKGLREHESIA